MKKLLAICLILSVMFLMGCTQDINKAKITQEAAKTQPQPTQDTTSAINDDVDSALDDIDNIDEELDMEELDSLEDDLNFEI